MAQRPGTPRLLREINDRTALELLLHHGAMTRGQLVERTGLSKPTASQLLARLEALGLVAVTGTAAGARGPSAQVYAIEATAGYAMGVDVSPGSARAGVADLTGQVQGLADGTVDARRSADPVAEVATVVRAAARAARVPLRRVAHLVVASPGVHDDARDVLRHAEHMPAWARPGLRAALEAELHFGFVGVPALSVSLIAGWGLRYESTPDARVWSVGVIGAGSAWGALSNLFVRYYL
ncbi:MAG TPA: helix-turn-helix domain-containing protein [Mycobacteriales bacterium]|nr:helix-turn-helix domain-containing protein [Mycobacteriales bacterium]